MYQRGEHESQYGGCNRHHDGVGRGNPERVRKSALVDDESVVAQAHDLFDGSDANPVGEADGCDDNCRQDQEPHHATRSWCYGCETKKVAADTEEYPPRPAYPALATK